VKIRFISVISVPYSSAISCYNLTPQPLSYSKGVPLGKGEGCQSFAVLALPLLTGEGDGG